MVNRVFPLIKVFKPEMDLLNSLGIMIKGAVKENIFWKF